VGNPEGKLTAFHATISGSVQGVGFRYSACREARRLGLQGWVRNLSDGDVEIIPEGQKQALAEFREWLDEGPPGAWIRSVNLEMCDPSGHFSDFSIE